MRIIQVSLVRSGRLTLDCKPLMLQTRIDRVRGLAEAARLNRCTLLET